MKKIVLLSDTHGFMDDRFLPHCKGADEIWHAGDIGESVIIEQLSELAPVKAVYGNIDGHPLRHELPEWLEWETEQVKVLMTHIGGRSPKFVGEVKDKIASSKPAIFVCGHSHILLVQFYAGLNCLHLNPGAAGRSGWHKVQTLLKFCIDGTDIRNMEVIELKRKPLAGEQHTTFQGKEV
jgi:putative phosphoesterase